jgi:hypothetical protein
LENRIPPDRLRKNADGSMVPETFLTEMNQVLDDLEAMGIPADEFRLPKSTPVDQEFGGEAVIDGRYFRVKLDAAIRIGLCGSGQHPYLDAWRDAYESAGVTPDDVVPER